jgi:hypothetical protein
VQWIQHLSNASIRINTPDPKNSQTSCQRLAL